MFGIVLIALGVWQAPSGDFVGGMWYALIGLFVYAAAQACYQRVVMREALRGGPGAPGHGRQSDHRAFADHHRQLIDTYVYRHRHNMFPVVDNGRLVGCGGMNDIKRLPRDRWSSTAVAAIMKACSRATAAIGPDTDAMGVLSLMTRTPELPAHRERARPGGRRRHSDDVLNFLNVKLNLEEPKASNLRYAGVARETGARQQA